MGFDFDARGKQGAPEKSAVQRSSGIPGKQTLTESLVPPGQRSTQATPGQSSGESRAPAAESRGPLPSMLELFGGGGGRGAEDPSQVHAAASRGVATPSSPLPHLDAIQRSFGKHDVSGVKAHVGEEAIASAKQMGAKAYATGAHVVLGAGTDLHTVAHEAAHVVQQRGGVQLKGGVGQEGDAYERQADEVADEVVRGRSVETLLDRHTGQRPTSTAVIQRTILDPPNSDITTDEGVRAHPRLGNLSEEAIKHAARMAQDSERITLEKAIRRLGRKTAVAAVNLFPPQREGAFLAQVASRKGHVDAYDPNMYTEFADRLASSHPEVEGSIRLHRESIASFGSHVPNARVYVPNPGPNWLMAFAGDLASCLDSVLGADGKAYVLTDVETSGGQAEELVARIEAINRKNANNMSYSAMATTITELPYDTGKFRTQGFASLNFAKIPFESVHAPQFRLVKVRREKPSKG